MSLRHRKPLNTEKSRKSQARRRSGKNQVVRVPKDYPWKVMNALYGAIGSHLDDSEASTLRSVIDRRDIEGYLQLSSTMGLQSINSKVNMGSQSNWEVRVMLSNVLKKYQFLGDRQARKDKAIETVLLGEKICSDFNKVGRKRLLKATNDKVLNEAKWFIHKVIGHRLPEFEELTQRARHGPGASTGSSAGQTTAYDKYAGWPYEVTAGCFDHACDLIEADGRWYNALLHSIYDTFGIPKCHQISREMFFTCCLKVVGGNKITTVPKNAQTERSIAIEPEMNMMLQLGVDGFIRRSLRPWGIDLDDQTKNQRLAHVGSLRQDIKSPATLDLAMASDTISLGIAKILLPKPWFRYLCAIRSPKGTLPDGSTIRFSKLSSMGNGSTFAIESLLFAALTFGANKSYFGHFPKGDVSVFGDDIITPEGSAPTLVQYLKLCGFTLNHDKSFLEGSVKESCGTDWYRGNSMRPVFLTEAPSTVGELFSDRNRLTRWLTLHGYYTSEVKSSLDSLFMQWVPHYFRSVKGPPSDTEFDTYWHDPCSSWRKGTAKIRDDLYTQVYKGRVLYSTFRKRKIPAEDFNFLKLSARLVPDESYVDPRFLPKWLNPLRKQKAAGSVFEVYDSNRIQRGVRQRIWYEIPDSYCSAVELLYKQQR